MGSEVELNSDRELSYGDVLAEYERASAAAAALEAYLDHMISTVEARRRDHEEALARLARPGSLLIAPAPRLQAAE
jgi:hypothetical protein